MILSVIHVIVLACIAVLVYRKAHEALRIFFWPAILFKCLAGIGLGVIYYYYYQHGDTINYFLDGSKLADLAISSPIEYVQFLVHHSTETELSFELKFSEPRALLFSKLTSVVVLLSNYNYWIVSLYFSCLSFYASWFLVRVLYQCYPSQRIAIVIAFLFVPSAVFWSAGLIKECIAMACIYFLTAVFLKVWHKERIKLIEVTITLTSLWLLLTLKYYYFTIFIAVLAAAFLTRFVATIARSKFIVMLSFLILLALPIAIASLLHPNFYPERFLNVIVTNNQAYERQSDVNDIIVYGNLKPTWSSIMQNSPKALFSALFRPLLWESGNVMQLLASIENLLLIIVFVTSLLSYKKWAKTHHLIFTISIVVYVTLLAVFLALSTPNFGTLSRYKVAFLSFFVLLTLSDNIVLERILRLFK